MNQLFKMAGAQVINTTKHLQFLARLPDLPDRFRFHQSGELRLNVGLNQPIELFTRLRV